MKKNIVAIGGGTGLSNILKSMKKLNANVTAIVNMADDGGSSGVLRADLNSLPPGDLRNCIVAMSSGDKNYRNLLNYRFKQGILKGHNLGNLILSALEDINGNMADAINSVNKAVSSYGQILPVTLSHIYIKAELENGKEIFGESSIALQSIVESSPIKKIQLIPDNAKIYSKAKDEILNADYIIIAPGSLYTSIIPALMVNGVKDAIKKSNAKCIYISNLMTEPGETDNYSLKDYILKIEQHLGEGIIDSIIVNNKKLSLNQMNRYILQRSRQVLDNKEDIEFFEEQGIILYSRDLIRIYSGYIRHNNSKLLELINEIIEI